MLIFAADRLFLHFPFIRDTIPNRAPSTAPQSNPPRWAALAMAPKPSTCTSAHHTHHQPAHHEQHQRRRRPDPPGRLQQRRHPGKTRAGRTPPRTCHRTGRRRQTGILAAVGHQGDNQKQQKHIQMPHDPLHLATQLPQPEAVEDDVQPAEVQERRGDQPPVLAVMLSNTGLPSTSSKGVNVRIGQPVHGRTQVKQPETD